MKHQSLILVGLAIAGLLLGLGAGILFLTPSSGDLEVLSDPAAASVFANDAFQGVTPIALKKLPLGPVQVRLARAGCLDAIRTVLIHRGMNSLTLQLASKPMTASLVVQTDPSEAYVWLDGERGPETPLRLEGLPAGHHALKVEKAGYVPHEASIELSPGQEAVVSVKLLSSKVVYYRNAIRQDPSNPINYVELGRILVRNGETDESFEMLQGSLEAYAKSGPGLDKSFSEFLSAVRQAQPALNEGRWPALFKALLGDLRDRELDDPLAGVVHQFFDQLERWPEIVELATLCLEKGGSPSTYLMRRALAAARINNEPLFLQDFQQAMNIWSAQPVVSLWLAQELKDLRRWSELARYCDLILERQLQRPFAVLFRMEALARLNRREEFEREEQRLLKMFREGSLGLNDYLPLRPILLEFGRKKEMLAICEACFGAQPKDIQGLFWLLEAHYLNGNWQKALSISEELLGLEIEPPGGRGPLGFHPHAAAAVLWAFAWAKMELGDKAGLDSLIEAYQPQKAEHYWIDAIRGELWRRRPEGDSPKRWLDAPRTDRAPAIDGRLDDEMWVTAGRSSQFLDLYTQETNDRHTTILAGYDSTCLYIGILAEHQNVSKMPPMAFDRYPNLRLELFLDTRCDYRTYQQFMFSADGFQRDLDCIRGPFDPGFRVDDGWNPAYDFAAKNEGEKQSFELAIPFKSLESENPGPGTVWGFNLVHLGARSVTFVPLGPDFHSPGRFAFLRFR